MTAETRDLRAKISVKADQALAAKALARNCDKQDVLREILDRWADEMWHDATLTVRLMSNEGKPGSGGE